MDPTIQTLHCSRLTNNDFKIVQFFDKVIAGFTTGAGFAWTKTYLSVIRQHYIEI